VNEFQFSYFYGSGSALKSEGAGEPRPTAPNEIFVVEYKMKFEIKISDYF